MFNYDIKQDLSELRETCLKYLLGITLAGGAFLFAVDRMSSPPFVPIWIALMLTVLVSHILRRRQRLTWSAGAYLIGLLLTFSLSLWHFGPSTQIYFLLFMPVFLSILHTQGLVLSLCSYRCEST